MLSRESSSALDLPPPPPRGRRLAPAWLRGLLWVDEASRYDAFLSYRWAADLQIAPILQSVLQQFLRPWDKVRAKTIFRDLSSLPLGSSLEAELRRRIDQSTHFIVLACPEAAKSAGMEFEAQHWFSRTREGDILIVVTSGDFKSWQEIRENALAETLR